MQLTIREGIRFGVGIDSIAETPCAKEIEFDATAPVSEGQKVQSSTTIIETQEQLMEALDISVRASARYGISSGNARFDLAKKHEVNEYSIFVLFKAQVDNPPLAMVNP
jgi:hypothetical protein